MSWAGALAGPLTLLVSATAAAAPADVYVTDLNRPTSDGDPAAILQVDPSTGAEIRRIVPSGPGVEPLRTPVGIAVDAQGYLIVADEDGYGSEYLIPNDRTYPCGTGCGAVLRVNPADGSAQVLSTGPYWTNPSSVVLPPDGDLFDDGGGPADDLLVLDTGQSAVIRVDAHQPPASNQSVLFESYTTDAKPPGSRDGLRRPWDFARDPDRPDELLITNIGVRDPPGTPLEGVVGCDDDTATPGYAESDGYLARMSATTGQILDYVCDPQFRKPRGIVVAPGERMFVSDPFAESASAFAGLFRIDDRDVQMLSLGGLLQTPSGLSFTYSGKGLLLADESSYPPPTSDCRGAGCGGVLAIDPAAGDQRGFSEPGEAPDFRDPIDVAVDRSGAQEPSLKPERCRKRDRRKGHRCVVKRIAFFNVAPETEIVAARSVQRRELTTGVESLVLSGLGTGAHVRLTCLTPECTAPPTNRKSAHDLVKYYFPPHGGLLQGEFRIAAKRRNLKAGPRTTALTIGRYADFAVDPQTGLVNRLRGGCLKPGKLTVRRKGRHKTVTACAKPSTR